MTSWPKAFLVVGLGMAIPQVGNASSAGCDKVLTQNIQYVTSDRFATLSVLSLVKKDDWEAERWSRW
jgi:hypothetical protein